MGWRISGVEYEKVGLGRSVVRVLLGFASNEF